jgi:GTP-binding protein
MAGMTIKEARFLKSSTGLKGCPRDDLPEYAFIGRSNVGKSSLINMLTNRNRLAKTSSSPGKTQLINHFLINQQWYLVDLPGYGFARMPAAEREKMMKMIREYVLKRPNLVCLFLVIDARLEMQKTDRQFLDFLGSNHVPFALVFTKTDKISGTRLRQNIDHYKSALLESWESLPAVFLTSALRKKGRKELLEFIQETLS